MSAFDVGTSMGSALHNGILVHVSCVKDEIDFRSDNLSLTLCFYH